jgi:glyoxylase-like metal-dependent hydrolase (beta-lactamase superfamily II)
MGRDRSVRDEFRPLDLPLELTPEVRVVATPGHTPEDLSVLVRTPRGVVAIVGDLFESASDAEVWVQHSQDPERQRHSRAEVLQVADFIVPGHGDMFATR